MDHYSAAFDLQRLTVPLWKDLDFLNSIQRTSRILRIGFSLSKRPHLHRAGMTQNMDMTAMAKVFISNSFKPCFFVVSSSPEYRPTNNAVINQKLVEARILFEGSFSATTVLMVLIK